MQDSRNLPKQTGNVQQMTDVVKATLINNEDKPCEVDNDSMVWYAMCDLKRSNALDPAYKMLERKGFEVFTPLKKKVIMRKNVKIIDDVPIIQDLLFVHSKREHLDPIVAKTPTLRYRFLRGGKYQEPTIVRDDDMNRFIAAVKSTPSPKYYAVGELTPDMIGSKVHITGGPLDGLEVSLRKMRGSNKKRIIVEIPCFIAAVVEVVDFDYMSVVQEKS